MRYLLDTNIVSDLINNPDGEVARRALRVGEHNLCTSIIVAAELRSGAAKRQSKRLAEQVETVLAAMEVVPFESPADLLYASVRAKLEKAGKPISGNDTLIAAHALALGCTLVTDNEREFRYVQSLRLENWLRRD